MNFPHDRDAGRVPIPGRDLSTIRVARGRQRAALPGAERAGRPMLPGPSRWPVAAACRPVGTTIAGIRLAGSVPTPHK